jgi:hypothetical protein
MRSLRDIQNALQVGLPLYTGPFGEPRGSTIVGAFVGNKQYRGGSADGASLSMGAPLGKPGGELLVGNPEHYERRALGMGTSLYGVSAGATWGRFIYWDFEIWLKGLWRWSVSLRGSSVKGTWRGAPSRGP